MTIRNYHFSYMTIRNIVSALLRVSNGETKPWTPVLSYQVELVCNANGTRCWWGYGGRSTCQDPVGHGATWVATGELKVLVDKGYATVEPKTGTVCPTDKFVALASQVLPEESGDYPNEDSWTWDKTQLRPNMDSFSDGSEPIGTLERYTYYWLEMEGNECQLRSKVEEEDRSYICESCGTLIDYDDWVRDSCRACD